MEGLRNSLGVAEKSPSILSRIERHLVDDKQMVREKVEDFTDMSSVNVMGVLLLCAVGTRQSMGGSVPATATAVGFAAIVSGCVCDGDEILRLGFRRGGREFRNREKRGISFTKSTTKSRRRLSTGLE
jgi:hypothetical protein